MRGPLTACIVAASVLNARCAPTDAPHRRHAGDGIAFEVAGHTVAHHASGRPCPDARGSILGDDFAIARPDSLGGVALLSFQPTGPDVGNLLILQAPLRAGTYTCADAAADCVGTYLIGVRNVATVTAARRFRVTAGSLTVRRTQWNRLAATFRLTLSATDGSGRSIRIENGTIDVPYVTDGRTDAPLACVLSLTGLFPARCRA
jgi:hypothetical protein